MDFALAGYFRPDPHAYDDFNAVADGLGPASIGTVVYEARFGTGSALSSCAGSRVVTPGGPAT